MMKSIIVTLALTSSLFAADRVYVPNIGASTVAFEIPYTAGIVKGASQDLQGKLILDENNQLLSGRLTVPLEALKTGNPTRDCHMREAMGIDYTNSAFPGEHVCNNQNQTPPTGPNSVVFPNIDFEFSALNLSEGTKLPPTLEEGKPYAVQVKGRFTMHGKTNEAALTGNLVQKSGALQLALTFPVALADYGIVVKSALGITIGKAATVKLNLNLKSETL